MNKILTHFLTVAAFSATIALAQEGAGGPPPPDRPEGDRPPRGGGEGDRPRDDGAPPRFERPGGGERRPGEGMPGNRDRWRDRLQQLPAKPQPYLGVATSPLDGALSAQLGLTPGLGLTVEEILDGGPAATVGVQVHDVIKQVNDQLISNPAHLAALTRHYGKDTEVTLLLLRKGQEVKVPVKIGERMVREPAPLRPGIVGETGMPGFGREPSPEGGGRRREGDRPDRPRGPGIPFEERGDRPQRPSADLLREAGPGGAPAVRSFEDRVSTTWNTAGARVSLKNSTGEIDVRSENGKRSLTAKNPKGETVFEGAIDTEDQRKAIPPEFRAMLEQVEAQRQKIRPGGGGPREGGEPGRPERRPDGPAPRGGGDFQ